MTHFLPGVTDPIDRPEVWPPTIELRRGADSIAEHLAALRTVAAARFTPTYHRGRGIVYVGGGAYWPGIVVGIRMLRGTGCKLPVEVWYRGSCEPVNPADVADLDVWLIDAEKCPLSNRVKFSTVDRGGWESKLYALSLTMFNEVLFLDADAYCVTDPVPLFDLLTEREPLVFWEDMPNQVHSIAWDRVWPDGTGRVPTFQGGQFLIDLHSGWRTLAVAHWMCQHSDYYFGALYGDQDCWRVALAATGAGFRSLGPADWEAPAFVCRHDGAPYVVHRCQSKMFVGKPGPRAESLPGEARAWELFASLTV